MTSVRKAEGGKEKAHRGSYQVIANVLLIKGGSSFISFHFIVVLYNLGIDYIYIIQMLSISLAIYHLSKY